MNEILLEVRNIIVRFGGVTALNNVYFDVTKGEFLSIIGPNGAGKTTMLRAIIGVVKLLSSSRIFLADHDITDIGVHERVRMGLAMTHQIVRPFKSMTVLENVVIAAGHKRTSNPFSAMFSFERKAEIEKAMNLLDTVGLSDVAEQPVTGQPLGVLKRLEVARTLAVNPRLLLLDEPLAGLNHVEAKKMADTIVKINQNGLTIVMIEHNLAEVLRVSQRLIVLDNGIKIASGNPDAVLCDSKVRAAYMGKEKTNAAA